MLHITLHEVIKQAFRHQRSKKPFCVETHFQTTASFSEPISLFVAAPARPGNCDCCHINLSCNFLMIIIDTDTMDRHFLQLFPILFQYRKSCWLAEMLYWELILFINPIDSPYIVLLAPWSALSQAHCLQTSVRRGSNRTLGGTVLHERSGLLCHTFKSILSQDPGHPDHQLCVGNICHGGLKAIRLSALILTLWTL